MIEVAGISGREHVADSGSPGAHAAWYAGIAVLAFLIPFVFTSLLDLDHDLYYFLYFTLTLAALTAYVRAMGFELGPFLSRNWRLSLAVGAVSTAFVVWNVLARTDSTPHPDGAYYVFQIGWRGIVYGIVDSLLLNAFPGMVAYSLRRGNLAGIAARVQFAGLAFVLTLVITATYHLGYDQFRGADLAKPELGNTVIELPVLISANPIGSIVAHGSMHVAAVTHSYETDTFLPPQTLVDNGD